MNPLVQRLGWALVHSLWQGAAAWLALQMALTALRRRSAQARYVVACVALAVATVAPWVTFFRSDLAAQIGPVPTVAARPGPARGTPPGDAWAPPPSTLDGLDALLPPAWTDRVAPLLPWLVLVWAAGAALRAAQLGAGWTKVRQLARAPGAPLPPRMAEVFSRLCAEAELAGRVVAKVSALVDVPVVIGWLKPVVLLPPAAILGLSGEQLAAVLAHELAHIRRHDFVVNLLQSLGETVFYYHPAIRAINRRIRLEREQACDDAAVRTAGDPLVYARALATLAEPRGIGPLALAARGSDAMLVRRVRRLLGPEMAGPSLPATGLAAAGLYLGLLLVAPVLTAKVMTAAERVATLRQAVPESVEDRLARATLVVPPGGAPLGLERFRGPVMRVSGIVLGPDGSVLNRNFTLSAESKRQFSVVGVSLQVRHGRFAAEVPAGALQIIDWPAGYAPVCAGPYLPAPGTDVVPPITITLRRGYAARLRFVDTKGRPVSGVLATGTVRVPHQPANGLALGFPRSRSGPNGEIAIHGLTAGAELHLRVLAAGYQMELPTMRHLPVDGIVAVKLAPAVPTTGRVVDATTGQPVANARIVLAATGTGESAVDGFGFDPSDPAPEALLARTGRDGRFTVDTLNSTWGYRVYVEAAGYAVAVESLASGHDAEYRLQRGWRVAGWVRGLPPGPAEITCSYDLPLFVDRGVGVLKQRALPGPGAKRAFSFEHLPAGPVALRVVGSGTEYRVDVTGNADGVVYDVAALRQREEASTQAVTIALNVPDGAPTPVGDIAVVYRHEFLPASRSRTAPYLANDVGVVRNGRVVLPAVAPGPLQVSADGLIGYWFPERRFTITPGRHGRLITIDVVPAGAIRARCVDEHGAPIAGGMMECVMVRRPRGVSIRPGGRVFQPAANAAHGLASFTSVPLGGTYEVVSMRGCAVAVSRPILVDAAHPLVGVDLTPPRGVDLTGRVVDEAGTPVRGAEVMLTYDPTRGAGFDSSVACDALGQFTLAGINFNVPGTYELTAYGASAFLGGMRITRDTPRPIRLVVRRSRFVSRLASRARARR